MLKPGRTCEILATNALATDLMASPAVADKALFLPAKTYLFEVVH